MEAVSNELVYNSCIGEALTQSLFLTFPELPGARVFPHRMTSLSPVAAVSV